LGKTKVSHSSGFDTAFFGSLQLSFDRTAVKFPGSKADFSPM